MSTQRAGAAEVSPPGLDGYMSAAEVAAFWGVHIGTVRRWSADQYGTGVRSGKRTKVRGPLLQKHRIGRRKVAFKRSDVEKLMIPGTTRATTDQA